MRIHLAFTFISVALISASQRMWQTRTCCDGPETALGASSVSSTQACARLERGTNCIVPARAFAAACVDDKRMQAMQHALYVSSKSWPRHPLFLLKDAGSHGIYATAGLSVLSSLSGHALEELRPWDHDCRWCPTTTLGAGGGDCIRNPITRTHCKRGCIRNSPRCSARRRAPKQKQLRGTAETRASHASGFLKTWLAAVCAAPSLRQPQLARATAVCQARGRRRMPHPCRIAGAAAEPAQAFAPEQISMIWLVICACRLRLYASVSTLRRSRALSDALFIAFMRAASSDASASCMRQQEHEHEAQPSLQC